MLQCYNVTIAVIFLTCDACEVKKKIVSLHPKNKEIHLASCQSPPPKRGVGEVLKIYNYMMHKQLPPPRYGKVTSSGTISKTHKALLPLAYAIGSRAFL